MPTLSFVILQPTPFCNIDCRYCYLPNRASKARMTHATVERTFSRIFESGWVGEELFVAWHGGEPLSLPIDYYEQAFEIIAALAPPGVRLRQAFQTNATLVTDQWCSFFKRHDVNLGVSVDGPAEIHDAARVTRAGKGTHVAVLEGIRRLRHNSVDFTTITVLTALSLEHPAAMYDFFREEGIRSVCFNDEELEGANRTSSLGGEDVKSRYAAYMREFWNLNVQHGDIVYIRELNDMFQKIMRPNQGTAVYNTLAEPFEHLNVDYQGNFSTFCPEFLGQTSERYHDFIIGNVWNDSLEEAACSEPYLRLSADVAAGVELCRRSCQYFAVCGGGAPVNKYFENDSIVSTETTHCRLSVQAVADLALDIIEQSATAPDSAYPAAEIRAAAPGRGPPPGHVRKGPRLSPDRRWDIRLILPDGDPLGGERLQASSGLVRATGSFGGWPYDEGAIIPALPWRPLGTDELRLLVARSPAEVTDAWLKVVRIPDSLLDPFAELREVVAGGVSEVELAARLASSAMQERLRALSASLRSGQAPDHEAEDRGLGEGLVSRPPGLPTTSADHATQKLVGLHIDNWFEQPVERRRQLPIRLCLNLGCEDRHFLFSPVPVDAMKMMLGATSLLAPEPKVDSPLARAFLVAFPDIPILRLCIRPGEAYVAPTELLAHDSSTWGRSTIDLALHILGRFEPFGDLFDPEWAVQPSLTAA